MSSYGSFEVCWVCIARHMRDIGPREKILWLWNVSEDDEKRKRKFAVLKCPFMNEWFKSTWHGKMEHDLLAEHGFLPDGCPYDVEHAVNQDAVD